MMTGLFFIRCMRKFIISYKDTLTFKSGFLKSNHFLKLLTPVYGFLKLRNEGAFSLIYKG
jgi:hypothetical protein